MPRYHFNVYDGHAEIDQDGTALPDIYAARAEAMRLAGGIIADAGARADLGEDWRFEVTDANGLILFRMDFIVAEIAATARKKQD